MPRLKVFCTVSGFHDAVVAATNRPAALKAWGAKTDLFSMGVAKEVTDPHIKKKALERPGEVIRLKRDGGREEAPAPKRKPKTPAKRPSSARLKAAEKRLATLAAKQEEERDKIDSELKALEAKRDQLHERHAKARASAEIKVEQLRDAYRSALDEWSED